MLGTAYLVMPWNTHDAVSICTSKWVVMAHTNHDQPSRCVACPDKKGTYLQCFGHTTTPMCCQQMLLHTAHGLVPLSSKKKNTQPGLIQPDPQHWLTCDFDRFPSNKTWYKTSYNQWSWWSFFSWHHTYNHSEPRFHNTPAVDWSIQISCGQSRGTLILNG